MKSEVIAFIALGSNLGDSRRILTQAIARLQEFSDAPVLKSSLIETAPVDCPLGSPNFLNAVVGLAPRPSETPESLHAKLQALEKEFGRQPKEVVNEPRPLDLDLIAFGSEPRHTAALTLPHPRARARKFVLQPLAEIAPDFVLPGQNKTVAQLLAGLRRSQTAATMTTVKLPPLILASASPRRQELLRLLDIEFRVVVSDASELHDEQFTVRETAQLNAYRKARAVAKKFPDALVLGADTLVYLGTKLFGKPANYEEAHRMLKELAGHTQQVVTGVCLMHLRSHRQRTFSDITDVRFRALTAAHIQHYLAQLNPLDKAGAYAIQERGELIIEEISGSFSNVVGLPVERLRQELSAW